MLSFLYMITCVPTLKYLHLFYGYAELNSLAINLCENLFHAQFYVINFNYL